MKRKLLSMLALLVMAITVQAAPITVTWNYDDITGTGAKSFTKDGVTITTLGFIDYQYKNFMMGNTFTTTLGNFTKIQITGMVNNTNTPSGTGWSGTTWTGNASSVPINGNIYGGGKGNLKIEFTIEPPKVNLSGITLDKTSAEMTVGDAALTLTATVAPDNATDKTVTWTTSDPTVATVADGTVTAVAAGTATITATATNGTADTSDDKTATCTVTVSNPSVTLTDGNDLSALLTYAGKTVDVTYTREFTAGKASTVCLPFAYEKKAGEKFYAFTGIEKEGSEYVATMTEEAGATLTANTPYLYMPSGNTDFSGTYAIPAPIAAGTTTNGDWTFVGNYAVTTWTTAPTGIYGFSGLDKGDISQGQFVKVGENVSIAPMRCYLKYKDGTADYQAAPQLGRRAGSELPQSIRVRLVNANGEVTSIGEEISVKREDAAAAGWYMLDGRKLSAMPTQKGIYIVNGKKVVIK